MIRARRERWSSSKGKRQPGEVDLACDGTYAGVLVDSQRDGPRRCRPMQDDPNQTHFKSPSAARESCAVLWPLSLFACHSARLCPPAGAQRLSREARG